MDKLKIGIIGAGNVGTAFAKHVTAAGYEVVISNSRGAETLTEIVKQIGGNITVGSVQDAAKADVVFLALRWEYVQQVLSAVSLEGKVLIDPTNSDSSEFVTDPNAETSSEVVSRWAKGAKVVKAFNTLYAEILEENPRANGGNRVLFYSGNDADAKDIVAGIIDSIGFAGVDLGRLDEGGKLQRFPGGSLATLNLILLEEEEE